MTKLQKPQKPTPIHLLMRFSDKLGFIDDTIEAHANVIKKRGAAWFGKMGKTLGHANVRRINTQCKDKVPTYLYLFQKSTAEGDGRIYRGDVLEIVRQLPSGQKRLIPEYYATNNLQEYIRLWTKLSKLKQVPAFELTRYVIASSGSPVLVTLGRSMAALFLMRGKNANDGKPKSESEEDNDPDWNF